MALKQPPLRPPPQVFGPMWTLLYGLMGYAAYRAWTTGINSFSPTTIDLTKACPLPPSPPPAPSHRPRPLPLSPPTPCLLANS